MNELDFTPEELSPELRRYLTPAGEIPFPTLRHPLVFSVPYYEPLNKHLNLQLKSKQEALETAKPHKYVFLHERPYRVDAFEDIEDSLSNKEYWELLGSIWTDSENIWQNQERWVELLASRRKNQRYFMDADERKALKALPDLLTVYRGAAKGVNEDGLSWTLDEAKAKWFSGRLRRKGEVPKVLKRTIHKSEVFAYLLGRDESEIILKV